MLDRLKRYLIYAAVFLVLLGLAGLTGYCARDRAARREAAQAARSADKAALRAAGALTAERVSREEAEAQLGDARAEVERLKNAVPGTQVVEVVKWKTETIHASGTPLPDAPPLVAGCGKPTFGGATTTAPAVLRLGDAFRVEVTEAKLETTNGAKAIVGQAKVIRETTPEVSLGEGKIAFDVSKYVIAPQVAAKDDADAGRAIYGAGVGLHDGLGGSTLVVGGLAVGRTIGKSSWRPYVTASLGLQTVKVGGEERRPLTAFAGFAR